MKKEKALTLAILKKKIDPILKGQYFFIILLGSAGTKRFHSESDIDLAVYFKTPPTFEKRLKMNRKIQDAFSRDCDLVILNNIDPIFARQVLETGRELSILNHPRYNIWKAEQLSIYPDFKRSREIIERNILNRKKYV